MKTFSKCKYGQHYGPHAANQTCDWLLRCQWTDLDCLPYGHKLVPSDFHLFGPFKKPFSGKTFPADANVKQAVTSWLQTVDTDTHYVRMKSLVSGGDKCLNINGDFFNRNHPVVYLIFNKMILFHPNTTTLHQFLGYMFRFLQNHLQANVNYMEVHSVCTYIMGSHSVYIKP
jgi:hypothetical protein